MKNKTIIQFQAINVPNHVDTQTDVFVYALTEDGKLYMTDATCKNPWHEMVNQED